MFSIFEWSFRVVNTMLRIELREWINLQCVSAYFTQFSFYARSAFVGTSVFGGRRSAYILVVPKESHMIPNSHKKVSNYPKLVQNNPKISKMISNCSLGIHQINQTVKKDIFSLLAIPSKGYP